MDYTALSKRKALSKNSPLLKLDPILNEGLIQIGERLKNSPLSPKENNLLILHKHNHVFILLIFRGSLENGSLVIPNSSTSLV